MVSLLGLQDDEAIKLTNRHCLGRCLVRVRYCVSLLAVDIECGKGIVRACGGVNEVCDRIYFAEG